MQTHACVNYRVPGAPRTAISAESSVALSHMNHFQKQTAFSAITTVLHVVPEQSEQQVKCVKGQA